MTTIKLTGALALAAALAAPAQALPGNSLMRALMQAGAPVDIDGPGTADSPDQRIDPNVPTSPFSGVVSINVRFPDPNAPGGQASRICTGTLIDPTHILSAGHCVDTTDTGTVIDVSQPYDASGRDVRVVFNGSGDFGAVIPASNVVIHPDFQGYGVCPAGVDSFCVNDDLSIITLSQPAPADAQVYALARDALAAGTSLTMVGYGTSGDAWSGYTLDPSFTTKRSGTNNFDLADLDDEGNFESGLQEVWYGDFDGAFPDGEIDLFCDLYGVCSGDLGNQLESVSAPGDSGGPAFIRGADGNLYLAATSTFGGAWFEGWPDGTFGTVSGGILLYSYLDWIYANSGDVPEPAMLGLFGLGAGLLIASRRRRR